MIRYRFKIGTTSNIAYCQDDIAASDFAKFTNSEWERDTIILKETRGRHNVVIEIEIGNNDIDFLSNLKIVDMRTWNT